VIAFLCKVNVEGHEVKETKINCIYKNSASNHALSYYYKKCPKRFPINNQILPEWLKRGG